MAGTIRVREDLLQPITFHPSPAERRLRRLGAAVGALLAVQAVALAGVDLDGTLTVGAGGSGPGGRRLAGIPAGAAAALVVAVRAAPLLAVAWGPMFCRYVRSLRRGHGDRAAGAAAAAVTAVAVALGVGAGEVAALVAVGGSAALGGVAGTRPALDARPVAGSQPAVGPVLAGLPWLALGAHVVAGGGPADTGGAASLLVAVGAADAGGRVARGAIASRRAAPAAGHTSGAAVGILVDAALGSAVAWLLLSSGAG